MGRTASVFVLGIFQMEILHSPHRHRNGTGNNSHHDDDMDDFQHLLDEDMHGAEQARLKNADDVLSLLEENARLRGLVVKLSDIIIKSIADQK
jgi:hypothetical protein